MNTEVRPGIERRFCIAPMMDCSDRHARYFLRMFSGRMLLYTEMVTAAAILHGDRDYLLGFNAEEHPLAVQLGGSDPETTKSTSIAAAPATACNPGNSAPV
jgi:tRNA-dihydrouridine synthase A